MLLELRLLLGSLSNFLVKWLEDLVINPHNDVFLKASDDLSEPDVSLASLLIYLMFANQKLNACWEENFLMIRLNCRKWLNYSSGLRIYIKFNVGNFFLVVIVRHTCVQYNSLGEFVPLNYWTVLVDIDHLWLKGVVTRAFANIRINKP